jgi:MtN3 and saliva related transmembrane protein
MDIALLGFAAGALTTTAWLPQLHRTWRSRSAADISWPYLVVTGSGIAAWVAYGLLDGDLALLVANVVTLALIAGLVVLKLSVERPGRRIELPPLPPRS